MVTDRYTRNVAPSVRIVGDPSLVASLARILPPTWLVHAGRDVDGAVPDELVLLVRPRPDEVREAHDRLGDGARLVVLIDAAAPAQTVADVLDAGAGACVRGGSTAVVAGHLQACHRRLTAAGQWPVRRPQRTPAAVPQRRARNRGRLPAAS